MTRIVTCRVDVNDENGNTDGGEFAIASMGTEFACILTALASNRQAPRVHGRSFFDVGWGNRFFGSR